MLGFDAPLSLGEFLKDEAVPLASVFRAVLQLLSGRDDAVVFGAHAVNAYLDDEKQRMTGDVDVLSTNAAALAELIRSDLHDRLHIATRVREMKAGQGYRVYQQRQPKPRHLVDVRQVTSLPPSTVGYGVRFVVPVELLAMKTMSYVSRRNQPKGSTDLADIQRLLVTFPALREEHGAVAERMALGGADDNALATWRALVRDPIEDESDEY